MGNAVDSRQKILNVSERLFAQKGFDKATVSEIAGEAGVNKALIYYYFKSKEEILETLFECLLADILNIIGDLLKFDDFSDFDFDEVANVMLDYILSKRDILRIAMLESMKSDSKQSIIVKIIEMLMSAEIDNMRTSLTGKGIGFPDDLKELNVAEFFTGTLPLINYALFKDEFMSLFDMNEEEYKKYFIKVFKQTHFSYHMNFSLNK